MYPKLWVYLYSKVYMIGLDIQTQYLRLVLLAYLTNDGCQLLGYSIHKYLPPIFGTPHHMILARVVDIPIRLVGYLCAHTKHYTAMRYLLSSSPHHTAPNKERPIKPLASARGFMGRS